MLRYIRESLNPLSAALCAGRTPTRACNPEYTIPAYRYTSFYTTIDVPSLLQYPGKHPSPNISGSRGRRRISSDTSCTCLPTRFGSSRSYSGSEHSAVASGSLATSRPILKTPSIYPLGDIYLTRTIESRSTLPDP